MLKLGQFRNAINEAIRKFGAKHEFVDPYNIDWHRMPLRITILNRHGGVADEQITSEMNGHCVIRAEVDASHFGNDDEVLIELEIVTDAN